MSSSRTLAVVALAIAVPFSVACTVIFAPRDDVQRCGNVDDCDPTGDKRYVAVCDYGEESFDESEVEQVCVATLSVPGCAAPTPGLTTDYGVAHDRAIEASHYAPTAEGRSCLSMGGVIGCPPVEGVCSGTLTVNDNNLCDDGSGTVFSAAGNAELQGQDVRDQYCRSFFCDNSFVCNEDDRCVPCDPDKPFGQGGCGELYISGALSCFYTDATDKDACKAPNSNLDKPAFGDCE